MLNIAHRIILSTGLLRALIAFSSGAVGALAMAPFSFWPAMLVPLVVAVWLIDGSDQGASRFALAPLKSCCWLGWLWGFGYFVAGLWWLGAAFLVEGDKFAALLPFGVLGLPAVLALFTGLGFTIARIMWSHGVLRIFALSLGLGVSEWLRGHLFSGFPWNEVGMAFGNNIVLAQTASIFGLYGLNLVVLVVLAAPAVLLERKHLRFGLGFPLAAMVALTVFGTARLYLNPTKMVEGVKLRLVQPNISIDSSFRQDNRLDYVRKYIALSDRSKSDHSAGISDVTHVFWPESSLPTILSRDAQALSLIGASFPSGTTLIVGAARMQDAVKTGGAALYYNSMQIIKSGGTISDSYDKIHLVPFGEYLPLEKVLHWLGLTQFVEVPGGFSPGVTRSLLSVPGLPPVWPSICYEAIFPDEGVDNGARAGLIINVTVDTWYGDTPGPYQHFAQARLRAVEQGLPLVRDANSGISAVIDPVGRILGQLPLNSEDVLDSELPVALARTPYATFGEIGFAILLGFSAVLALVGKLKRGV